MFRIVCFLFILLLLNSKASAGLKSNANLLSKVDFTSMAHLSQLFYPADILDKFENISQSKKKEYCEMRGNLKQLRQINLPKKISGLTSRMFGSTDLIGVDETSEFVRIFNNLAAQAFFVGDKDLKVYLADVLHKLAQSGALKDNKLCVKDGEIICAEDWLDDDGQDKSGKRDSNFAHNMATRLSYAYYAYVDSVNIDSSKRSSIDQWFGHFAKANPRPKFQHSLQGGGYVHAVARAIIEQNKEEGACFGDDCNNSMNQLFSQLDNSINDDGSVYPNTFRGDRALYYHNDALNEIFILMEMGRNFGYSPSDEFLSRLEKAVEIFLTGYEDHQFMDTWANEGINGRVRPGKQQFGTKNFRENPSNSWYYIFLNRYPESRFAIEMAEKYKINNLERSNSDMMWAMSYKCIYNLVTEQEKTFTILKKLD